MPLIASWRFVEGAGTVVGDSQASPEDLTITPGTGSGWTSVTEGGGYDVNQTADVESDALPLSNKIWQAINSPAYTVVVVFRVDDATPTQGLWQALEGSTAPVRWRLNGTGAGGGEEEKLRWFWTPTASWHSANGVVTPGVLTATANVFDSNHATAADRGRVWLDEGSGASRLTPSIFTQPTLGQTADFSGVTNPQFWVGDAFGVQRLNGVAFWVGIWDEALDDATVASVLAQVLADNDTDPTTGGGAAPHIPALRETVPDEPPQEARPRALRRTPESVDLPPWRARRRLPEEVAAESVVRRAFVRPPAAAPPEHPTGPRPRKVSEEPVEEAVARRRLAAPSSVDQPPRQRTRVAPEESVEERVARRRFSLSSSVDAPPRRRATDTPDETLEERAARRRPALPSSVDQPPLRARRALAEEPTEEKGPSRARGLAQSPAAAVDQPPRKHRPRGFEEFEPEPRVTARRPVPLPSGAGPAADQPPRLRRALAEPAPEEPRARGRLAGLISGVDSPPLPRRRVVEIELPDPERQRRRLGPPVSVDAPPPARARQRSDEPAEERPRSRRTAALQVEPDALPFRPRRRAPEDLPEEKTQRRLALQPPPPPPGPGDMPPPALRRRTEEPAPEEFELRARGLAPGLLAFVLVAGQRNRGTLASPVRRGTLKAPTRRGGLQ